MMRGKGVEKNAHRCTMMCFQFGETSDVFSERVSPLVWEKTRHLQRIASVFFLKIAYLCISVRAKARGFTARFDKLSKQVNFGFWDFEREITQNRDVYTYNTLR
ncbi:hypothetical protein KSD_69760 [Ktedonobacter sp. SOSP1-85]|nr:hypothetical protein KSD_69760 [Ktedonobacter sp. SOSP1-85]